MKIHRNLSILLTISVLALLVLVGPANALKVNLNQPSDTYLGLDVQFMSQVFLESEDSFLPIQHSTILITGPNGFSEVCTLENDGSITNCNLDLDVTLTRLGNNGYGYGYEYGYGYNFGYGYGFEYFSALTYDIIWHTDIMQDAGEYKVTIKTLVESPVLSKEYTSEEKTFNLDGSSPYCSTLYLLFKEAYGSSIGDEAYNDNFDFNEDGTISASDFAQLGSNFNDEEWCQDKIPVGDLICQDLLLLLVDAFGSQLGDINYNSIVDFDNDNDVDLQDLAIFANKQDHLNWCAEQFPVIVPTEESNSGGSKKYNGPLINVENEEPIIEEFNQEDSNGNLNEGIEQPESTSNLPTGFAILDNLTGNPWMLLVLLALILIAFFAVRKMKGKKIQEN